MKILVATEKPFAPVAIEGIRKEVEAAGHQLVLLEKYNDKAQLIEAVADADALIVRSDKVTPEVLDAAKNLKIVVRAGAGYDSIDTAYAKEKGIVVENTPGQNANAVAELVFGLLVYAVRNFYNGKAGTELMGKKLGLLAFGNVGRNVARIAKGFGMDIYAYDAYCPASVIEQAGVHAVASQDELFQTCDVVSLHMDAFKLVKRIDKIVYRLFLVPCEIETDMLAGLILIDEFNLIVRCHIFQDGCQFSIFVDDGFVQSTILLCQLGIAS